MVSMKNLIIAGGFIVFSFDVEKFYQYVKGRKSLFY